MIQPPHKLETTIGQVARQVARLVQPCPRPLAAGVRYEALGRQLGPLEVATRQPISSDVELAGNPQRDRLQVRVQQVDLRITDGLTNRDGARGRAQLPLNGVTAGKGGALRRPIAINQLGARQLLQRATHVSHRESLPPGQQLLQASQALGSFVEDGIEQRGGQPRRRHLLLLDQRADAAGRGQALGQEDAARPMQQGPPQLEGRGIKGDGGHV